MSESFAQLTAPYHRRLYGIALSLCKDPDQASDLTQDALVRAYRKFDMFRPGAPVLPWLARILRNLFLDSFKTGRAKHELNESRLNRDQDPSFFEGVADQQRGPLDLVERAELLRWLRQEVRDLPPDHRLVVTLCDTQGLSYAEAAEVCDVPLGTVRSRLSRARAQLRRRMHERVAGDRNDRNNDKGMEPSGRANRNDGVKDIKTGGRSPKVRTG